MPAIGVAQRPRCHNRERRRRPPHCRGPVPPVGRVAVAGRRCGDDGFSGGKFGRYVLPTWQTGLVFRSHLSWFSFPPGCIGIRRIWAVHVCGFSGDAMASSHLVRSARSASKVRAGVAGVPLWVPLKNCVSSSGGWSASTRLSRLSATSQEKLARM
jgi:hypothetical protein